MDTPDKAAGMADSSLADAVNKEWLLTSGQSSQLSTDLKRYQLQYCSSNSLSINSGTFYGATATSCLAQQAPTTSQIHSKESNSNTWLLRHYYSNNNKQKQQLRNNNNNNNNNNKKSGRESTTNYYSINHTRLYDNISFADSPIFRSLSAARKGQYEYEPIDQSNSTESTQSQRSCCFGKFRIFLACYVLFGITLSIYSRNALSLAAVGMVKNMDSDYSTLLAISLSETQSSTLLSNNNTLNTFDKLSSSSLDGSCPIVDNKDRHERSIKDKNKSLRGINVTDEFYKTPKDKLEAAYKSSIEERIKLGQLIDWSPSDQALVFAAGSVGNLLTAIPLTRMGEIYGPKWVIFVASLGATIQAAFMPLISSCHVSLVILFQVIFNGLTFGADCVAYTLFAYWLTPTEMAFFVACLMTCYQLGTTISSFITAQILARNIAWCWCFYIPAFLCGLWCFIWAIVGASEPAKSFLISKKELKFLLKHSKISQLVCDNQDEDGTQKAPENHSVSWLKLAKDPNIWAIIAVKFTLRWFFSVYTSLMPTYLSSVAHMSVKTIGTMSVFQNMIGLFSSILMGFLTRSVVVRRPFNLSLPTFRKTFQSIVNFGMALSLTIFIIWDCDQWVTITTLTFAQLCVNFHVAAAVQLPLDLSPTHCGLITSISNTLALGQAIGAPISGLILNSKPRDRFSWRIVWSMAILLNTLSGLLFIILVDSKPRDYSKKSSEVVHDDNNRSEQ